MSRLRAYLELFRLPTVFTAMADVLMGAAVATAGQDWDEALTAIWRPLLALTGASSCLYLAGMVLNDYFDRQQDLAERPKRPIPSGRIAPAAAYRLGAVLLLLGLALALGSTWLNGSWRPAIVGAVLATCVVAYDAALKKTVAGPLAMGACRALNALLGMSVVASADSPWRTPHFLIAGGLGVFVAGITAVGRKEARQSDRAWLLAGLFLMWGGMAMIAMFPYAQGIQTTLGNRVSMWPLVWLVLGLQIGWRILRTLMDPSPRHVQAAVQSSIVLLVVLDAIVTFAVAGTVPALVVLSLIVPTLALSRWLYMT